MPVRVADRIRLFCSLVERRRFDDGTLQILESALVFKDVKSLLTVQSSLQEFMRHEYLCIILEIADKSIDHKLHVLQFLVCAFALAGDIKSCLALRYEALILRELKSVNKQSLQVSCGEWMSFAEHSFNNGFYSVATKACEKADSNELLLKSVDIVDKIKRLKDVTAMSSGPWSVQAQAMEYLQKRKLETSATQPLDYKEEQSIGSTLFRDGIKKRNIRKLRDHQRILNITSQPDPKCY